MNAASVACATFAPGLTWGADYNLPTTYTMQYLFNIQRAGQLDHLEVGYKGNESRNVNYLVNPGRPLPGNTPFDIRVPYPEWGTAVSSTLKGTASRTITPFSAKQTALRGAFDVDVELHVVEGSGDGSAIRGTLDFTSDESRCRACDYGTRGSMFPAVCGSALYTLPFGKGQPMLNGGGVVDHMVGRMASQHHYYHPERDRH